MVDKTLMDLQEVTDIICGGNFKKNDVLAFMIKIRQLKPIDSLLVDLCDFLAHSEGRNKGESHRFVNLFLTEFINANENNVDIVIPTPLFNKNEVIQKILDHLSQFRLVVDQAAFTNFSDKFINYLLESLDGVKYKISNPKVKSCFIKKDGTEAFFCFQLQNISQQAIIRRDGPGKTCVPIFYNGEKKLQPIEVIMQ